MDLELDEGSRSSSPSHFYHAYLKEVLSASDGRLSSTQISSLESLRSRFGISEAEHTAELERNGWSEEKLSRSRAELPMEYVTFLRAIMVDGVISEDEARTLTEIRGKYSLSETEHLKALAKIGFSERDYLLALAKGTTASRTEERFGRSKTKIVTEEVHEAKYCRGLFIAPNLHQWWSIDKATGKKVIARKPGAEHRAVSSEEAFFDLIVVSVISKLVMCFSENNSNWLAFIALFFCIWRVWMTANLYNSSWETKDLTNKLSVYVQMFGLIWMGVAISDAFENNGYIWFAIGFLIANFPFFALYLWAVLKKARGYDYALAILLSNVIVPVAVFSVTVGLKSEYFLIWWLIASVIPDLYRVSTTVVPILNRFRQPISVEHMTERFAIFILIVLGEAIASLMKVLPWNTDVFVWEVCVVIALGLALAISIKWLYFNVDEERAQHPMRRHALQGMGWVLLHAPLALAIATYAAGFDGILEDLVHFINIHDFNGTIPPPHPELAHFGHWTDLSPTLVVAPSPSKRPIFTAQKGHEIMLCTGISGTLLLLLIQALLSKYHEHQVFSPRVRFFARGIVAVAIGLMPLVDFGSGGLLLIVSVSALVISLVIFEMVAILPSSEEDEDLTVAPVETLRDIVAARGSAAASIEANKDSEADLEGLIGLEEGGHEAEASPGEALGVPLLDRSESDPKPNLSHL